MKIKNLSGKIIGIGLAVVLPGETQELPAGFAGNPVIAGFQAKGLVELINDEPQEDPAKAVAEAEERVKADVEEAEERAKAEAAKAKYEAEAAIREKEKAKAEAVKAKAEAAAAIKDKEKAEAAIAKAVAEAAKLKADVETAKNNTPEPEK